MNRIRARITHIETQDHVSLVHLESNGITFTSVILETGESSPFIRKGNEVTILFKETEVSIAKDDISRISLQNRIRGTISQIEKGRLLSRITADTVTGPIRSLITTAAAIGLELEEGDDIFVLIKTNEIMLSE